MWYQKFTVDGITSQRGSTLARDFFELIRDHDPEFCVECLYELDRDAGYEDYEFSYLYSKPPMSDEELKLWTKYGKINRH